MAAKSKLEELAREQGKTVPELLQQEYARRGTRKEVAKALGVASSTVGYALLSYGLEERTVLAYSRHELVGDVE